MFMQGPTSLPAALTQPWHLPPQGLAVFHGEYDAPRLSHYFLPRLALEGKRVLFLDGANSANPRLIARLAERRGIPFAHINRQIKIARAFTCFQLTELISRVPQFLADFPAQVLMVTAFPELYFDEDVRDADAQASFRQALGYLRRCVLAGRDGGRGTGETAKLVSELPDFEFRVSSFGPDALQSPKNSARPLTVALFSSVSGFQPPARRKLFFNQTCAAATELWKFQLDAQGRLGLMRQDEMGNRGWGKDETRNSKIEIRPLRPDGVSGKLVSETPNFEFRISSFDPDAWPPTPQKR